MRSRIYVGHVMHARTEPAEHHFRYPAFVFALDIDELPLLDARLKLFGHNRRALFAVHEGDYLGDKSPTLRGKLGYWIQRAGATIETERVELVTTPRFAGHAFNPVSFYYCYRADGSLSGVVTEVNNTFGEGHVYVLDEPQPWGAAGHHRFSTPKRLHVSPFHDMRGTYEFDFAPLGRHLDARIDILRAHGKTFYSRLRGDERPLSNAALLRLAISYPMTAALTLPRILWQAYKLHYRRRLPVFGKPEPSSESTFRASRPAYISEFAAPTWLQRRDAAADVRRNQHGSD